MKYLIRYCCVFLCSVSLLIGFSVTASAETVDVKQYSINQSNYIMYNGLKSFGEFEFVPHNDVQEKLEKPMYFTSGVYNGVEVYSIYTIKYNDLSVMFEKGKSYKINLSNFYYSFLVSGSNQFYVRDADEIMMYSYFSDGSLEFIYSFEHKQASGSRIHNFTIDYTPSNDVKNLVIYIKSVVPNFTSSQEVVFTSYFGEFDGDNRYSFDMEVESQEAGLLKSVIEWLKGIKNGISDLFDSLGDIFDGIAELPSKIWCFIETGLKSLFVPSENYMVDYKDDWDMLLSQRFGAVYEVCDLVTDIAETVNTYDETNTIELPITTIELPNNNNFTFGGYSVPIVPNGFEHIANLLKLIIGIVCTLAFLNGMLKRYDELMGVEQ